MSQATATKSRPSSLGLTKPGVVVMQTLLISIVTSFELFVRKGTGIFTGLAICIATLGTIRFARAGTEYVSAATGPLVFAAAVLASLIAIDGFHPSRLGLDIVSSFATAAPYLLFSATCGWINFLRRGRKPIL